MLAKSTKYAFICGVFLLVLFRVSFWLGIDPFINITHLFFDALLLGLFVVFAQLDYKKEQQGLGFHFWQGMTIGFIVYGGAIFLFLIGLFIFLKLDADLVINYRENATNFLNERMDIYKDQFGEDAYRDQVSEIQAITELDLIKNMGVKKILVGFLVTPVISIILRKKPN